MNELKKLKVFLSAGGTGGHMTPARALSDDLRSRGYEVALVTDTRGMKFVSLFGDINVHTIRSGTLGRGVMGKIKGLANLGFGFLQARKLIAEHKPDIVVGFGGYPSVPAVYMAQKLQIPTIIHESNAIIGKANAFLAPKAERIALSLPYMAGIDEMDKTRAIITGNPVRPEIGALYTKPYPLFNSTTPLNVLIMGGSLGAEVLSKVVPHAFAKLSPEYKKRLHIMQQCRAENLDEVKAAYKEAGIDATTATFFENVPELLTNAHLVISRSGASTVAEVTVAGRPAIFVPATYHKDEQQKMNADSVGDHGGAWVMTENSFTPETLLTRIETFFQNPEVLFKAAENARSCGKPDAARKLGNLVTAIASGWD